LSRIEPDLTIYYLFIFFTNSGVKALRALRARCKAKRSTSLRPTQQPGARARCRLARGACLAALRGCWAGWIITG